MGLTIVDVGMVVTIFDITLLIIEGAGTALDLCGHGVRRRGLKGEGKAWGAGGEGAFKAYKVPSRVRIEYFILLVKVK